MARRLRSAHMNLRMKREPISQDNLEAHSINYLKTMEVLA